MSAPSPSLPQRPPQRRNSSPPPSLPAGQRTFSTLPSRPLAPSSNLSGLPDRPPPWAARDDNNRSSGRSPPPLAPRRDRDRDRERPRTRDWNQPDRDFHDLAGPPPPPRRRFDGDSRDWRTNDRPGPSSASTSSLAARIQRDRDSPEFDRRRFSPPPRSERAGPDWGDRRGDSPPPAPPSRFDSDRRGGGFDPRGSSERRYQSRSPSIPRSWGSRSRSPEQRRAGGGNFVRPPQRYGPGAGPGGRRDYRGRSRDRSPLRERHDRSRSPMSFRQRSPSRGPHSPPRRDRNLSWAPTSPDRDPRRATGPPARPFAPRGRSISRSPPPRSHYGRSPSPPRRGPEAGRRRGSRSPPPALTRRPRRSFSPPASEFGARRRSPDSQGRHQEFQDGRASERVAYARVGSPSPPPRRRRRDSLDSPPPFPRPRMDEDNLFEPVTQSSPPKRAFAAIATAPEPAIPTGPRNRFPAAPGGPSRAGAVGRGGMLGSAPRGGGHRPGEPFHQHPQLAQAPPPPPPIPSPTLTDHTSHSSGGSALLTTSGGLPSIPTGPKGWRPRAGMALTPQSRGASPPLPLASAGSSLASEQGLLQQAQRAEQIARDQEAREVQMRLDREARESAMEQKRNAMLLQRWLPKTLLPKIAAPGAEIDVEIQRQRTQRLTVLLPAHFERVSAARTAHGELVALLAEREVTKERIRLATLEPGFWSAAMSAGGSGGV